MIGSKIVAGGYTSATNFATSLGTLSGASTPQGVLVAYSNTGTALWQKRFGGTSISSAILGVSGLSGGDVIVVGRYTGTVDFGGTSKTSISGSTSFDGFVARYNGTTGALVWVQSFGSANDEQASAVSVDASDRIDVTGYFRATVTFGTTTLTNTSHDPDLSVFLAQYDANGNVVFAQTTVSDTGNERGYAITTDPSSNIYIMGSYSNTANYGGGNLPLALPSGGTDCFVWSTTSNGTFRWAKGWGNTGGNDGAGGKVFSDGSGLYFISSTAGSFNVIFASTTLTYNGSNDVVVGKYDATNGTELWGDRFGSSGNEYPGGITKDGSGNIIAGITVESPSILVGTTLTGNGNGGDFVTAKLNASTGAVIQGKRFGGTSSDNINEVVALGTDVVMPGYFYSDFTLAGANGSPLTASGGNSDAVLVRSTP